jgi:hypothetical protein
VHAAGLGTQSRLLGKWGVCCMVALRVPRELVQFSRCRLGLLGIKALHPIPAVLLMCVSHTCVTLSNYVFLTGGQHFFALAC